MNQSQFTSVHHDETKIIILCENCLQKLRIPKRNKKIQVTCPRCRHTFDYRYYPLGLSSNNKRPLLVGLVGSLAGFLIVEIIEYNQIFMATSALNVLLDTMLIIGAFGTCLGGVMGAAEGFFQKNNSRLYYGLIIGAILGLVSGVVSGALAQLAFSAILTPSEPSFFLVVFARIIGWCILGLLLGISFGIKENTIGDVKYGLIGGAIGGAIGGLLFDPLSFIFQFGGGTIGRLVGFSALGMAIGTAIHRFREVAISNNRPEMYKPLTRRLPANSRLMLPPPDIKIR